MSILSFDTDFLTTVLYHLRYELVFSALFAVVLLLSPDVWSKVSGKKPAKAKQERKKAPQDPAALAAHITELSGTRYGKAMDVLLASDSLLEDVGLAEFLKVVSTLAVASVRVGRVDRVGTLLKTLEGHLDQSGSVLVHLMRVLASRQMYAEALQLLTEWQARCPGTDAIPSLAASCVVQCAVEMRNVEVAEEFFSVLQARSGALGRDYSAMIRLYAALQLAEKAKGCLSAMQSAGLPPDNVAYNMVLSACADAHEGTDGLVAQMQEADIVTFNTRLKACARTKDIKRGFDIFKELEAAGLAPTQVTFGTLLEVCTRSGDLAQAAKVMAMMTEAGVAKNNIVYTSMIKGLAASGQLRKAMQVFGDLKAEPDLKPDVICFSVLIKAHCDAGQLPTALQLLENLLEAGHTPDEILFNNLLAGCAQAPHVQLGEKLLHDMVAHNIRPTMATFSILLKMYSKAGAFQQSAQLLETMPEKHGVVPAQRLYVQHISWCIRLRRGSSALQVYKLLLDRCPDAVGLDAFLTACSSFNMLDTACALIEIDPARFSAETIREIHAVLVKKNKTALVTRLSAVLPSKSD